ncbi:MAG: hypothetical protein GXO32_07425 [Crenarchaeota archaeon]|nr:hypothetical protein [Thermoproteota archaeon]
MARESLESRKKKILEIIEELNLLVKEVEPRLRARMSSKLSELYTLIMSS